MYNTRSILGLLSFSITKVTNYESTFSGTTATVGYARTTVDADKLNATSGKPAGLVFKVK